MRTAIIGRCICFVVWESNPAPCEAEYASLHAIRLTDYYKMVTVRMC